MTTQPRIPLDDLTSDALDALYDERDQYRADCQKWAGAVVSAEKVRRADAADADRYEGELLQRIANLEADVVRLTAGQCVDSRAMCEKHHLPPVTDCPYPRCRAARATGRAATA
ncbi:hypothetical protein ASD97_24735 [Streptomyces sp. Root63]|uniref:hypothetical protein n=1 Tax=unclassified Streptomyces TaxID=2593676 RepID=UPI0006FB2020|nr:MULTISPECIES: hypothetical protein [unclassified Streptomyces]KQX27511.1 hypothetical protein ASD29_29965 [Streptomyces sp. Root1295]KRA34751.1 hypothetical protein ASD97_24735 [Streptomyces sp. Root63]